MKTRKERQVMIIEPLFCSRHRIKNSTHYLTLPLLCVNGCSVAQLRQTLCDPTDCSLPVSSDHGILQQEYWSGLVFPPPGDLPNPGIEPISPTLTGRFFTTEPPRNPLLSILTLLEQCKENILFSFYGSGNRLI